MPVFVAFPQRLWVIGTLGQKSPQSLGVGRMTGLKMTERSHRGLLLWGVLAERILENALI